MAGAQKPMCAPKTSIAAARDHGPVARARAAQATAPATRAHPATRRGPKRSTAAPPASDARAIPSDAAPQTIPPIACEIPSSLAIEGMSGGSTDQPSPPPTACTMAQRAVVRPGIVRSIDSPSLRRNICIATPSMSPWRAPVKDGIVAPQHDALRYVPTVATLVVKKYGNRRLYDTGQSKYITLEELAETVRRGSDVQVLDAKTGQDLTQPTLTQIILESRGAARLLPVPLLIQLIRMKEDALAEFLGRWMTWALAVYQQARQGARSMAAYNPLLMAPFAATNALARLFTGSAPWSEQEPPPAPPEPPPPPDVQNDDVAQLRRELDELKRSLQKKRR